MLPPRRQSWRADIGSPGDEQVLVRGMAQREVKVGDIDLRPGWQTMAVNLPPRKHPVSALSEIRLLFAQAHRPAEKGAGDDRRVCNLALDWVALERVEEAGSLVLAVSPSRGALPPSIRVQTGSGAVRVDNGVLELEWREDAGGTLTRLRSKRTGRDYAAQSG